jgi:iturin family lipopeptide synthetase B
LKERLPEYMIPSYMMELDFLPLTNNGKINRTALPEPDINGLISSDYVEAQTALQETLVTIWREVLGVETIGIHDNFFDLGGHSLKATVVMSDIHKLLQIEVPLKEIFTSPTIFELSNYIEKKSTVNVYETIEPCEEQDFYETSSAQKRMYSVQQLDRCSTAYNMPGIFELEGEVDQHRIETVFQQLVKRHEALSTSYETVDGEIVQKIWPNEEFQLIFRELPASDIADIAKSFIQPFELDQAPLFRVELAVVSGKQYLMIDMHHIISDGVSMSLLLKEFTKLYNGEILEPLRIQYKDFAQWQNAYLRSGGLEQQAAYWKEQFQGNVPVLHLPYDYERPAIQSFEGDSVHFTLDEEMTEGLRGVAREEGATLHMVLLSAFNILLSKYSGQEDIVIGVPVAGRPHTDLQNMMGMFVNTLAMRNQPGKEKTFKEFLKEVKENSLQAYDNQSYQLEELIENIAIKRDISRNPLFDVIFNLNNIEYEMDLKLEGFDLKQVKLESNLSRVDLSLAGFESDSEIHLKLVYSTKLFKKHTIQRTLEDLNTILTEISKDSSIVLEEIQLFNSDEEKYILNEKNEVNSLRNAEFSF